MKPLRILLLVALLLGGCASERAFDEGRELIAAGEVEKGLAKLDEASKLDPANRKYRQQYVLQRDVALQRFLTLAESAKLAGDWDAAENHHRRTLALDPANPRAKSGLAALAAERRHRDWLREAGEALKKNDTATAHARVRAVLAENGNHREAQQLLRRIEQQTMRSAAAGTQLAAALRKPVTLEFRDTNLRQVFELISRSTGLNFIFDRDVRPDLRTTLYVRNTTIDDVLRFVMVTNQLERKVLNENTILVYPNTQPKNRDYQELVVKTFYLTNSDAKQTANMIRQLVKTKDLYIDEKLNLLVIRDTLDAVRMAERLIANQDLASPEVMLEVEVVEVGSTVLYELGARYPNQVSYSLIGAGGTPGTVNLSEWPNRNAGMVRLSITNPFLILNLRNEVGQSNILANPRIRVRNKEKAKVHIGDKVPVITSTTTATGVISESVNYVDVGIKLEVEPNVTLDDEVEFKVSLDVSNIAREIRGASGSLAYQLGTRNTSTALRLKDGETQILAGLISDEDRKSANQVPGLGSLPILGRLFGSHLDTTTKTEIVLLITPRIVRNLVRPDVRFEEFPSGTEAAIGAAPLVLQSVPLAEIGAGSAAASAAAAPAPLAAANRVVLAGPSAVATGKEFTLTLASESAALLRAGLIDLAFDQTRLKFLRAEPGAALAAGGPEVAFRASAPEGLGRLSLSFTAKADVKGSGEIARLTFEALAGASGSPVVRIEAASLTDANGKVSSAELSPPIALSLAK